jgi:hypothetical protein
MKARRQIQQAQAVQSKVAITADGRNLGDCFC